MNEIANELERIGAMSGRNYKINMIKEAAKIPGFKEILRFIFNPYIRTGIASAKLNKNIPYVNIPISWQDYIDYVKTHQTGSDADVAMARTFVHQQTTNEARLLAIAMATKDLKIGITENTLNQIFGATFIPKIGVMLGEAYEDFSSKVKGPFIVTEKLDGVRRILVKENGKITMYSRSGIVDEGLIEIEAEAAYLPDGSVFDGELLAIGNFKDSIALRQATNSIAGSKGIRRGLTFNIFDFIPLVHFKRGISEHDANSRKILLGATFNDESIKHLAGVATEGIFATFSIKHDFKFIKPVPILGMASTWDEIEAFAKPIWDRNFEGVMLNTLKGKYEIKRSRELLKVKKVFEYTLKVIGMEEGEGRNAGRLGAVLVDYKGQQVGVGSGLNDLQREMFWKDSSLIVGKMIEIESFGESTDKHGNVSLNAPIFKRVVGTE